MSESERSQSASSDVKSSHHLNHGKESDKKHRGSHESDSDKSSYSEEFYSDDESSRKNQGKKKELIGSGSKVNKGSVHKLRNGIVSSNHYHGGSGGGGEGSVAARHVLSANRLKVNDFRNKVAEMATQLIELQQENKDIRRQLRKRERCLEQYEQQENDMPTLLQRQAQESHVFREQLRRQKNLLKEKEKKVKTTQDELQRTQRLLKKMKELVDDKQLAERDELNSKLMKAELDLKERETAFKKLEEHIEHLKKNHKHELGIERARQKETNNKLTELRLELERIQTLLKEKERELSVCNIRASRQVKPPHRISSCTSTSPSSDIPPPHQVRQVRPGKNHGPNRKGSVASLDTVIDERRQQKKKPLTKYETELDKDQELERRLKFEREREIERQWEIEKERKVEKDVATETVKKQKQLITATEEKDKREEELHKNAKLKRDDQKDKGTFNIQGQNNKDEEMKLRLENNLHERDRKELEERDKRARELEVDYETQNLEEKERLKEKALLLAKMRAIDEQKVMNDKEFFLTTPSQNEFLPRERQMVVNDENIPAFGDYRPSFLTGSATNKPTRNGVNTNSRVGNVVKPKQNVIDELFGSGGDRNGDQLSTKDGKSQVQQPNSAHRSLIDAKGRDLNDDIEAVML